MLRLLYKMTSLEGGNPWKAIPPRRETPTFMWSEGLGDFYEFTNIYCFKKMPIPHPNSYVEREMSKNHCLCYLFMMGGAVSSIDISLMSTGMAHSTSGFTSS